MNRILILLFTCAVLCIAGGVAWYLTHSRQEALQERPAAEMPPLDDSLAIYTNGTYGFTVFYPEAARVSYTFDPAYHLGSAWRAQALPDGMGMPLVAFIPYEVRREHAYPRSFAAQVRIGISADPREMQRCLVADEGAGEAVAGTRTLGGREWMAFTFESAGMMQYARGISYRIVHDDRCIAMEQVRTGSSYRDEPHAEDIPDTVLDQAYEDLASIVTSFTFVE